MHDGVSADLDVVADPDLAEKLSARPQVDVITDHGSPPLGALTRNAYRHLLGNVAVSPDDYRGRNRDAAEVPDVETLADLSCSGNLNPPLATHAVVLQRIQGRENELDDMPLAQQPLSKTQSDNRVNPWGSVAAAELLERATGYQVTRPTDIFS